MVKACNVTTGQLMISIYAINKRFAYNKELGTFTYISDSRFHKIGDIVGASTHGYIRLCFGYETYLAHRIAWLLVNGTWPKYHIDHIDGDKTNNAIRNLRDIQHVYNAQNVKSARGCSKTGLLGAWPSTSSCRFVSQIMANGTRKHIGTFDSAEDAHQAYLIEKRRLHDGCTI